MTLIDLFKNYTDKQIETANGNPCNPDDLLRVTATGHATSGSNHGNPSNPENNTHGELTENIREQIEERAAIMEFNGGLSRTDAEQAAVNAIRVYCYRTKEKPDSELVAIMPNTSLAEAHESLSLRYGDRLLAVYENTPNLAGILAKLNPKRVMP